MKIVSKFKNALSGLWDGLNDSSILIQYFLMLLSIIIFSYLKITRFEWYIVILCFSSVIGFEYFNTCIEDLLDLSIPSYSIKVKRIKDMAAGSVLIASLAALIIGIMIILNHL